jgi:hypothetical protein
MVELILSISVVEVVILFVSGVARFDQRMVLKKRPHSKNSLQAALTAMLGLLLR